MDVSGYDVLATIAIAFLALMLVLALCEPGLPYKINTAGSVPPDSAAFERVLAALTDAQVHRTNRVEVLTNGDQFYEAELEAIAQARHSVNIEAYIFQRGEIARRFVAALAERARNGVRVNLVIDAIGSFATRRRFFRELLDAGGRVYWYH